MANVFITGASSGLGAALARRYAARGDTVGLVGRRFDAGALLPRRPVARRHPPNPHRPDGIGTSNRATV